MDGCSTSHFGPQVKSTRVSRRLKRAATAVAFLASVISVSAAKALAASADSAQKPVIATATQEDWQLAQTSKLPTTMQVTFATLLYERQQSIFSSLFYQLPKYFSHLKLNTIGRGLHSTLVYLDDFSLSEAKEVLTFLSSVDRNVLEQYDLLKPVKVFDPSNIEISVIGTRSRFIALKPHAEFVEWQLRFYKLLADKAPFILERHMKHRNLGDSGIQAESVHISLVQFGSHVGVPLNNEEITQVSEKIKTILREEAARIEAETHKPAIEMFSLSTSPIELVTAPPSIHTPPIPIVAMKMNGSPKPKLSKIGRWFIKDEKTGYQRGVEFYVDDLVANKPLPIELSDKPTENEWLGPPKTHDAMDEAEFAASLSPRVRRVFEIGKKNLSPTKLSAPVPSENPENKNKLFVVASAHPKLAPEKGFKVLETASKLGLKSTADVSVGLAVYASSVRKEIKVPGDYDMLINSIVHVPSTIKTYEEAEDFAAQKFTEQVLGQIISLAKQHTTATNELRMGSDAAMGIEHDDVIAAHEENPYLSEEHLEAGQFLDKKGRLWPLLNMVGQKEFIKGKVDLFRHEQLQKILDNGLHLHFKKRMKSRNQIDPATQDADVLLSDLEQTIARDEFSLQFLIAFEWNGSVHAYQKSSMKGVPPLLTTGVYYGAESIAIAQAMARAFDYYNIQKGSLYARAIRDLVKAAFFHPMGGQPGDALLEVEPLWNSKFNKKFYAFLILLERSPLPLAQVFFKEVESILRREGKWQEGYNYSELTDHILAAINMPEMRLVNGLKRVVNDFAEFNERKQTFRSDQWVARAYEVVEYSHILDLLVKQGRLQVTDSFKEAYRNFNALITKAVVMKDFESALHYLKTPRLQDVMKTFEKELIVLDGYTIAQSASRGGIKEFDKLFIKTMSGYAPHILTRYIMSRSLDPEMRLNWTLKFMGIEPSEANIAAMTDLAQKMDTLPREAFAKLQRSLFFSKKRPSCPDLLLKRDVDFEKLDIE